MRKNDKPLILVAEDDTITRMKLVRFLERELGATVLSAQNGDEAWGVYQENPEIQFVISDWVMPNGTGVDLCDPALDLLEKLSVARHNYKKNSVPGVSAAGKNVSTLLQPAREHR